MIRMQTDELCHYAEACVTVRMTTNRRGSGGQDAIANDRSGGPLFGFNAHDCLIRRVISSLQVELLIVNAVRLQT
jgi:hypothetical protein